MQIDSMSIKKFISFSTKNKLCSGFVDYGVDLNMDGKVKYNNSDNDKNWLLNLITISASPSTPNTIISQHTPN